ncbi:O-succinylhomoserine sulfhydrylase [Aestuariirhabdus litorea]|uniref:O-succinylhomoserine sulfhydrylase n=1 Tax=Aestuariirhabdus litorea TaxID=2528527 RepID=A0A3P3VTA9_9GAMM|nr:O-succinylhomoserine sulfhydrylase [Aestuariirhabdus litorea]RRJ84916.1 O-succinylhomoserine sulfhydrylase [Aestuariirhabdus litorea]RWW98141.1 O-succinylhomoserine sulfhydrylase [Endozoicomonadaceae bacterium GTF-13]
MAADNNDRLDSDLTGARLDTLAVRAGQYRTMETEHGEPIFTTSSYVFRSAADAAARFSGEEPGNVYSRYTNPTVRTLEERMAALEGAEQAVAMASGMAAILGVCMAFLEAGDHVVVSRSVFGTTTTIFSRYLKRFGVETTFVDLTDMAGWQAAVTEGTAMLFVETPSNPLSEVADLKQLASLAQAKGALLVVDNTFCTPILQRPLELGADIVVYSATKYLDGQGRCMGGLVLGRSEQMKEMVAYLRAAGPTLSPFNAWVILKGLETLRLRMLAHCDTAYQLALWLQDQPKVARVYYSGLSEHPQHALASEQQSGFGGVVSFEVKGGKEEAWRFIDATRMISITANLGDTKTTITHPATTTHGRLSQEERDRAGIRDSLIRVAAGLESLEDLKADLARGLAAV